MISLCTFVKNEAHCIRKMLDSVKDYVAEIVVVDTGSTDKTIQICEEYDARIYKVGFTNFGSIRTLAAHLARQPYILMLDADETLSNPLFLKALITSLYKDAYAIPRKRWLDFEMTQQTEIEAYPDWQVRLFRNDVSFTWKRELHEYFDGAAVSHVEKGMWINHFQDCCKTDAKKKERDELYEQLAKQAGVYIHGGKKVEQPEEVDKETDDE